MTTGTVVVKGGQPTTGMTVAHAHDWRFLRATDDGQRDVFYCARCLEKAEVGR